MSGHVAKLTCRRVVYERRRLFADCAFGGRVTASGTQDVWLTLTGSTMNTMWFTTMAIRSGIASPTSRTVEAREFAGKYNDGM